MKLTSKTFEGENYDVQFDLAEWSMDMREHIVSVQILSSIKSAMKVIVWYWNEQ